jgi:hypothetical protein
MAAREAALPEGRKQERKGLEREGVGERGSKRHEGQSVKDGLQYGVRKCNAKADGQKVASKPWARARANPLLATCRSILSFVQFNDVQENKIQILDRNSAQHRKFQYRKSAAP